MALKPIGIEDNNTFPGRVGTALTQLAKDANTDKLTKTEAANTYATKIEFSNVVIASDTAPVNPAPGTIWLDTSVRANMNNIPDLFNRWDATNLALAEGAAVSYVPSVAGAGIPLLQATTANQPTMTRTGIGNLPSVRYTKTSSQFMEATIGTVRGPLTIVAVFKHDSNESAVYSSNETSPYASIYYGSGNFASQYQPGGTQIVYPGELNPFITIQVLDGASTRVYWRSRTPVSQAVLDHTAAGFNSVIRVGRNSSTMYGNGLISEIAMFRRGLKDSECQQILDELSAKYSIAVAA